MTIKVRYFAALREEMGRASDDLPATEAGSVLEVWRHVAAGNELGRNTLCAVNMEYVNPDHPVRDGDEVAFFPPVTGG